MGVDLNDRSSDKSVVGDELFIDADCTCATKRVNAIIKLNAVDLLTLIEFIVVNCMEWNVFGNLFVFFCAVLFTHFFAPVPHLTKHK